MSRNLITLAFALLLVACSNPDRTTRDAVLQALSGGITDLAAVNHANDLCSTHQASGCAELSQLRQDIADAMATCKQDTSELCKIILGLELEQYTEAGRLPVGIGVKLPKTPFYWGLGNPVLDSYAGIAKYRYGAFMEMLKANRTMVKASAWLLGLLLALALVREFRSVLNRRRDAATQAANHQKWENEHLETAKAAEIERQKQLKEAEEERLKAEKQAEERRKEAEEKRLAEEERKRQEEADRQKYKKMLDDLDSIDL